jgi:Tfp pilus assembly protein FimT
MQKRNSTARHYGFTTVELMLVVVLVSVLTLALYGAASVMRRSFAQNTKNNYNLLAAKKGLSRIAEELRYATKMDTPASGDTWPSATFDIDGSLGNTIIFNSSNNLLEITKFGATTSLPAPLVRSVTFTRNNSRIRVTMVVRDASAAANPTLTLSTTVRMLNVSE